ncbi:putative ribosome biogenesis protein RLP24 [Capsicum annuum]|uniref:Ribosome biogenesis protein RLP24 n=1 Tax=Capsicum annuum TaxID=4072 RepID=A0A2G2YP89_CAPAN|nr:putative ribosome biogenesis protein RLP24 [Capsicum annuum]
MDNLCQQKDLILEKNRKTNYFSYADRRHAYIRTAVRSAQVRSNQYRPLETKDSTIEFERKRNRPDRYDRNVTENTLSAIKKIDKIRVDRDERHIAKRMKGKKTKDQREAEKELEQSIHIVKAPAAPPPIKVQVPQKQPEENRMEE